MHALRRTIEVDALRKMKKKRKEWQELDNEYQRLSKYVESSTCISFVDEDDSYGRAEHNAFGCPRCRSMNKVSRLQIQVFEDPLPKEDYLAKVIVFELVCPEDFAKYRNNTGYILAALMTDRQAVRTQSVFSVTLTSSSPFAELCLRLHWHRSLNHVS